MLDCTLPYSSSHQLIIDLANSNREVLELVGDGRSELSHHYAQRIHELMRFRSYQQEY